MSTSTTFRTMVEALELRASQLGDGPAFIFRNRHHARHVLTWADLYTLAGRFAAVLKEGGFDQRDQDPTDREVSVILW
jgi:acyl-CoA synthetase (AMP-forming)/AMP-acid ligase II